MLKTTATLRELIKIVVFALSAISLLPSLALAKRVGNSNHNYIFCPSPSQIIISDMRSGEAKSKDGKWTGVVPSAIPAKYKDNWRRNVTFIRYGIGGFCSYFIGITDAIDLVGEHFPYEYNLYDYTEGKYPIEHGYCWYYRLEGPVTTMPSKTNNCYFSDHAYK